MITEREAIDIIEAYVQTGSINAVCKKLMISRAKVESIIRGRSEDVANHKRVTHQEAARTFEEREPIISRNFAMIAALTSLWALEEVEKKSEDIRLIEKLVKISADATEQALCLAGRPTKMVGINLIKSQIDEASQAYEEARRNAYNVN